MSRVISVSAVGSMKESIKPGDVVLPDQFIEHGTPKELKQLVGLTAENIANAAKSL